MRFRFPLYLKLMLPLVGLSALILGTAVYQIYIESDRHSTEELDNRMRRTASFVARTINVSDLQAVRTPNDMNSPGYAQIQQLMEQARSTANVAWIGTYYQENGYFYYWVDVDSLGVGYPFFRPSAAHRSIYAARQPCIVQYADEFGSYYAVVLPILATVNGEEQVIGLVEANVYEEERALVQSSTLKRVLPFAGGGLLLAVMVSLIITHLVFTRPMRKFNQAALALAQGKLGHTVSLRTHDELGELARAFNRMSGQIKELLDERLEMTRLTHQAEVERLHENKKTARSARGRPHRGTGPQERRIGHRHPGGPTGPRRRRRCQPH